MAENEFTGVDKVTRDYVDNFSFKDMALNEIMPKFFEDEITNMTVGLNGMLTEYTGMIAEDGFNTASTLLLETFPTRASMDSSIYANAAIFQLSNVFSQASRCDFLIVIPESDIMRNFITKQEEPYSYFYLDKDTTIYVEEIPFTLDYDVVIRAMYKETQHGYVYSAKYDMSGYKNSVSPINDPYIKIRKTANGLIVLQVNMGQYRRTVKYESIIDNAKINFPTINVNYSENICGCDVLYKKSTETDYKTQLKLQVRYSQPSKEPFCYYRKTSDSSIQLNFTTKDTYFQPEFNSELMIVVYQTMAADGNFTSYDGENISLTKKNDIYQYDYPWAVSCKPLGKSEGGRNALSKKGLQDLTIEGFSTATALTTEYDLQVYFNNFKHRYGEEVLFLKKRDDTVERLFSAFLYVKKSDYFYPMNTLSLETNLLYFDKKEGGFYNMDPGMLFTYKEIPIYRVLPVYYVVESDGTKTGEYYDSEGCFHDEKGVIQVTNKKTEQEIRDDLKIGRLWQNPNQYYKLINDRYVLHNEDGSRAESIYKSDDGKTIYVFREGLYYLYDNNMVLKEELDPIDQKTIDALAYSRSIIPVKVDIYNDYILLTENELLYKFRNNEVTFDTIETRSGKYIDFLVDPEKELQARKDYLDYFETYKDMYGNDTMEISDYIFDYSFKDYKNDRNINNRLTVFDENISEIAKKHKFLFTNPFLLSITKSCGLVGFYMTMIDQSSTLDFINENDTDAFVQFITYTLRVKRDIEEKKKYTFELTVLPSVSITYEKDIIDKTTIFDPEDDLQFPETIDEFNERDLMSYDKSQLSRNALRVILTFYSNVDNEPLAYMEMIPTHISPSDQITFKAECITDDYVTTDDVFRVTHRCPYCGKEIFNSVNTIKRVFMKNYNCGNPTCKGSKGFEDGIINVRETDDIFLPINNAIVEITTLYRDPQRDTHPTNNEFVQFDKTYEEYHWTNLYSTILEPITFIQPMNLLRTNIEYMDHYIKGTDALDCHVYDIPVLKYSLIAYKDKGPEVTETSEIDDIQKFQYFLQSYTDHYDILDSTRYILRNNTNIDTKFYNTYGRSTNFVIGEENELIDTVNIRIYFDVWLIPNTDKVYAEDMLKTFIKDYVESINKEGTNDLYISNLIREIENNLAFVHHLKFKGINDYDTSYQAIKNRAIKLTDLTKEERRHFVPDLLTVNRANIILTFEEID